MPEVILLSVLAAVLLRSHLGPGGGMFSRILIIAIALLLTYGPRLVVLAYERGSLALSQFLPPSATLIITSVGWLATFEVMARWRPAFRPATLAMYGLSILMLQTVIGIIGAGAWSYASFGEFSPTALPDDAGTVSLALAPVLGIVQVVATVALYLLTYRLAAPGQRRPAGATIAHGGIEMAPSRTETTRLLCAAAVLNGSTFRRRILDQLEERHLATAPELGLDVRLLAQVCCAMERREGKYAWAFVGTPVVWLFLAAAIEPIAATVVAVAITAVLFFRREYERKYSFAPHFARQAYDPESAARHFDCELTAEIASSLPDPKQDLVVYRGFTPFAGSGVSLGGWSFVINLEKAKEALVPLEPKPFELAELYASTDDALARLNIGGMTADDVFFVSGTDVRGDRDILPNVLGRPGQTIDRVAAQQYRNDSDARVRHYRWFRVHDWSNELIVSQYFRCARRGKVMFVEMNRYLLTPVGDQYRTVDALTSPGLRQLIPLAVLSLIAGPLSVLSSAFNLLARFNKMAEVAFDSKERRLAKEITDNPLFDYGAPPPIRQALSSDRFLHYFQRIDSDFYGKVFDRVLLDAICGFLESHDIDTADLKERQSVILNSGIIVQGGDVRAESLAVGAGAQATKTETRSAVRRMVTRERKSS